MDNLETPYDEETEFIECTVCEKSLRGETLYKIHLTTLGHIKKEEASVAGDSTARKRIVPEFKDILQYLDYLKLDEPIIGLSFLDEVPCNDPQAGPRYLCRLCHHTTNLAEMVHHVIGRKHRQKYVELKRPDLVTWDKLSIITQGGKIIRARAEIIERQDGRGSPLALVKRGTEVHPRDKPNRNRCTLPRSTQSSVPPLLPELNSYRNEYSGQVKYPTDYTAAPLFHPDESVLDRDRQIYQRDGPLRRDYKEDELNRAHYRESDMYRREYMDTDNRRECEEEYVQDPHNFTSPRAAHEQVGVPRYDSRGQMPLGQAKHVEHYPGDAPSYSRPYPEKDPLKEFYSEEVRRRRVCSVEYQPSQQMYQDEHRWSLERESGRQGGMIRAERQGSSEPEAKKSGIPTPVGNDQSQNHLFNIIRDYQHERKETHQEDVMSNSGPGRTGPSTSQRQVDVTRMMSNIPEPFRRFLEGNNNDERDNKKKRKSRFTDATAEEVEMTKEMFSDDCGPPNSKFGCPPREVSLSLRPGFHGPHLERYRETQSPLHNKSYQKGGFGTEGIFDMLKNIEIENEEEAEFLKNKLCCLLNEFKSKKAEKETQSSHGRGVTNNNYTSLKADRQLSPQCYYERNHREDSDLRRPEGYFKEDHRGRGWKEHDKRLIEHQQVERGEPRYSNRSHHQEHLGWPEMAQKPHPDEPRYPERFQDPMYPQDYQPAAEEHFDSRSSVPPVHMALEPRMHRDSRYSTNLDKITSTLLELVARK